MRFWVRLLFTVIGIALISWSFRGTIYRKAVHYEIVGERHPEDRTVQSGAMASMSDLDLAIDRASDTTATWLHFTAAKVADHAQLHRGSSANCIGYAHLFSVSLGQALGEHRSSYTIMPVIGQLHMGNFNIHQLFESPFWKDHDIVRITDLESGGVIYIDPTLYDAVGIGRVRGPKEHSN